VETGAATVEGVAAAASNQPPRNGLGMCIAGPYLYRYIYMYIYIYNVILLASKYSNKV
jgi:hypothetical protein